MNAAPESQPTPLPPAARGRGRVAAFVGVWLVIGLVLAEVAVFVVHRLGYEVQIPVYDVKLRYPLAHRSARLYVSDTGARLDLPEEPREPVAAEPFAGPVTRQPLVWPESAAGALRCPNPELGQLAPPHTPIFDVPAGENPMDRGARPWRQVSNNYGFPDAADFVREKPAGERRVGFFGGSLVAQGSSNDRTIPACAERALKAAGRGEVRCLNFGYVSWVATQELAAYAHFASDLELDAVVLLDGANDLIGPWWHEVRPGYRFNFLWLEGRLANQPADRDALARRVGFDTDAWRERLVESYLGTVRRFRRVVPAGRPVLVIPQPLALYAKHGSLADYDGADRFARHALASYDRLYARLAELARKEPIAVHDLRRFVPEKGNELGFWDAAHTDDRGNRLLGEELAAAVARALPR